MGFARLTFAVLITTALACAQGKLAVARIALHQFEDGPVLASTYEFVPGETANFSVRIAGFKILEVDEQRSVKLSWHVQVFDPAGVLIEKEQAGHIEDKLAPQDKEWAPKFLGTFVLPSFAVPGAYRIVVKVRDEAASADASGELVFRVRGHDVQPSETLLARNFMFLRNEDDRRPMSAAIYHPGETLWARFDIVGYKFSEGNRFSVSYELAVLRPSGEQLFAQPDAAAETNQSFYPQRYVPGALSLTLNADVPKGSFVLLVTIHDKVGEQTWETKQPFEIQ